MLSSLIKKKTHLAVIGLGYVGLPIALEFAQKLSVIGFDTNPDKISLLKEGVDPSGELPSESFPGADITFSSDPDVLKDATFFIVAVPTPVDNHNVPDLSPLVNACKTIGKMLKKGDCVIFESTVYPGCTEDDCVPVLENTSGLLLYTDFKVGYSPERINPGDTEHTLTNIIKIVSGCDEESLQEIASLYELIVKPGVHRVSSIKVAEAAKVIENSQRDLNIAFMNELSIIFDRIGINTYEVLEAAGTKWNFLNFKPGLVGGHCIGVDPYYLTYKASELGFNSRVILSGRYINDNMGNYLAKKILQHVIAKTDNVKNAKVLVMGVTFKENVSDIRNSKVIDVIQTLKSYHLKIDVHDPEANGDILKNMYGIELKSELENDYDAIIVSVPHKDYLQFDEEFFKSITKPNALIADLKGIYRGKIKERAYWSF
ncbi:MAG: nucleotide sugar dehydrogenase [Chitinophagaceae bacterium]